VFFDRALSFFEQNFSRFPFPPEGSHMTALAASSAKIPAAIGGGVAAGANGHGIPPLADRALILVVDDNNGVRTCLRDLLEISGYRVETYVSAEDCLAGLSPDARCLITDMRMPGMDGLELQAELAIRKIHLPVIFITGRSDLATAVRGFRSGALDVLQKPFDVAYILGAVMRAVAISLNDNNAHAEETWAQQQLALLSPREQVVFDQLVAGHSSKAAAFALGISPRTIEIHRSNIRRKLKVRSLAEMTRIACAVPGRAH
jgi:two-component system response regulator FixJ